MASYKLWNKTDTIYTPSGAEFSATEMLTTHKWAKNPNAKVIISNAVINGGVFMEFEQTKETYKKMGATITDTMTDNEVLEAIENFEANPPEAEPTAEERIAAQLEFQSMMME